MSHLYASAQEAVGTLRPRDPLMLIRPRVIAARGARLVGAFPGHVMYAVKCNHTPSVLDALYAGGIRHFDVASLTELRTVTARFPGVECHYMHPVKSHDAVREAYFEHGVRMFALDHVDELEKILAATDNALDMTLVVRLDMPYGQAMMCLSGKFGASVADSVLLLQRIQSTGNCAGLTFHVGSQCVDTAPFVEAVRLCGQVIQAAGVPLSVLDIGGGFPGIYTGEEPEFELFCHAIAPEVQALDLPGSCRLYCEPGRALVADGASVITRVELRRDTKLYLNEGTYGSLAELKYLGNCFPMQLFRNASRDFSTASMQGFDLYGPTCDSVDTMPGPFWLPSDVQVGDWIEIGRLGAYSAALMTRFNGCASVTPVLVDDAEVLPVCSVVSLKDLRRRAA
ncbi:type III PLP-dependent enzyme [Haematospirillum jordaniae]|uniref:type III PLP-dependent enzyme n=1 Tax=Haematospirillum jordaniae TaxID=1549855 RepID=UPI001FD782CB|nr:type III PLP-dependent enzyme [Haematospirillum jordaniae]